MHRIRNPAYGSSRIGGSNPPLSARTIPHQGARQCSFGEGFFLLSRWFDGTFPSFTVLSVTWRGTEGDGKSPHRTGAGLRFTCTAHDKCNRSRGDHRDGGGLVLRFRGEASSWVLRFTSPAGRRRERGQGLARRNSTQPDSEARGRGRRRWPPGWTSRRHRPARPMNSGWHERLPLCGAARQWTCRFCGRPPISRLPNATESTMDTSSSGRRR